MRAEESVPVDDLVAYALFDIDPNIRRAHRPLFFFEAPGVIVGDSGLVTGARFVG